MNSKFQTTLSKPLKFEGVGLHSGKKTSITLLPASDDQGIILKE